MYGSASQNVTPTTGPKTPPTWAARCLHFVAPNHCLDCGEPVWRSGDDLGLCDGCRARLERWPDNACFVCQRPLQAVHLPPAYRCTSCRIDEPAYDRRISLWSYQSPLDAVLQGLKFGRLRYLARQLGSCLAQQLRCELAEIDSVVPVPLHWSRRLRRGYDQAQLLAHSLASELSVDLRPALRRRRWTPPQSRRSKTSRQHNLRHAFALKSKHGCRGRNTLLVDDVLTTGATLEAATRALQGAAPTSITWLTVARTPTHEEQRLLGAADVGAAHVAKKIHTV